MQSKKGGIIFYITLAVTLLLFVSPVSASLMDIFNDIRESISGRATSQGVSLNVTIGNNAPNIIFVNVTGATSPTEASTVNVYVNFTVYDNDGAGNLNNATAKVNITYAGESLRVNSTCNQISTFASLYANYTCYVQLFYFDVSGVWNVTASIADAGTSTAENRTSVMTYNQLTAFVQGPGSMSWASLTSGSTNQTSNNDPLILNNTGNKPITDGFITLNSTNLLGETDTTKAIWASNFTVSLFNETGTTFECGQSYVNQSASSLLASNFTQLGNATLSRGNNSNDFWNGTSGQRKLFFCIRKVGSELTGQSYSTQNQGSWTTKIA